MSNLYFDLLHILSTIHPIRMNTQFSRCSKNIWQIFAFGRKSTMIISVFEAGTCPGPANSFPPDRLPALTDISEYGSYLYLVVMALDNACVLEQTFSAQRERKEA